MQALILSTLILAVAVIFTTILVWWCEYTIDKDYKLITFMAPVVFVWWLMIFVIMTLAEIAVS